MPNIVGDPIHFRGFVYGPVNELGVVGLFSKISEELGFIIEAIRAAYPDCIARRKVKNGWEQIRIEFEYRSSNFKQHGHDPKGCELIVCWEHDWDTCPVPVLSLKQYVADARGHDHAPPPVAGPHNGRWFNNPATTRVTVITEGGIKNGYINIKPLDGFWPNECVGSNGQVASKHLIVEFEGIGRVTTDIGDRHKSLRSTHAEVKQFVKKHRLKPGDQVEIVRVAPYEYRVRPAK